MVTTVALTGATGFIGRAILKRLVERNWRVRALYRTAAKRASISRPGIEWVEGDLADSASLRQLVRGVSAVVHSAGVVRGVSADDFRSVNVAGVETLAAAAGTQPALRFLSISSLAARLPELSYYAASKREGEACLAATAGDMPWTVFRPPAVYGPGERELLPLLRLMEHGLMPVLAQAEARFSLLYVSDLARAVESWLRCGTGTRKVYELHDGCVRGYSWNDFISIAEGMLQRRVHRFTLPVSAIKLMAAGNARLARVLGYAPMLTPGKVRELMHADWTCDNRAIHNNLGWQPQVRLEEGLRRTLGRR